jgi:KaiC/GvpD/RAD55 family RecA-like ATPase
MSDSAEGDYRFGDGVPLAPIQQGSTVLVAGSALSPAEDLARWMVTEGTDAGEGALFISTNETCVSLAEACRQTHPSFDPSRVGVIDCSGQDLAKSRLDVRVRHISTQTDLTGIGMKFSALYESLYADAGNGRVRTGLISLSSLLMYVELRTLFRFAQTLAARIESAGGLGVFVIDPESHDTRTVSTLSQVVDGRISVRDPEDVEDADGELRVDGLPEQPSKWQPFSLASR